MKHLRFALATLATAALTSTTGAAQKLDQSQLIGRWSGNGSFFSAQLQQQFGDVPFVLEVPAARSATGQVGAATLQDVRIKQTRGLIEVSAKLKGAVVAKPQLEKDHLILLITAIDANTARAEFHLKSNSMFDPKMREGRVVLVRKP